MRQKNTAKFKTGVVDQGDRLLVFHANKLVILRPTFHKRSCPTAWVVRGDKEGQIRPDSYFKLPLGRWQKDGRRAGVRVRDQISARRARAGMRFLQRHVPADLLEIMQRFAGGAFPVWRLGALVPETLSLIEDGHWALLFALAHATKVSAAVPQQIPRSLRALFGRGWLPRNKIAGWLDLPSGSAAVRALRAYAPEALKDPEDILSVRNLLARGPALRGLLAGLPRINSSVVGMLRLHRPQDPLPSRGLLSDIGALRSFDREGHWLGTIYQDTLHMAKTAGRMKDFCRVATHTDLQRLHDELSAEQWSRRMRDVNLVAFPIDAACLERALPQGLTPILTSHALAAHARSQRNCLSSRHQMERCISGEQLAVAISQDFVNVSQRASLISRKGVVGTATFRRDRSSGLFLFDTCAGWANSAVPRAVRRRLQRVAIPAGCFCRDQEDIA